MFARHFHPHTAATKNLRRLFWVRNIVVGFLLAIALLLHYLDIPLNPWPIAISLGGMLLLNVMTWWRLRDPIGVSETELLVQLLGDIVALTTLFYFTGGYSNPFVWMYLLPLAIAAVALNTLYVWLVAGLAILAYSLLVFLHVPLSHLHVHAGPGMNLDIHLIGMWLGFMVSAGIFAFFVTRIGQTLREYDRLTAEARESALTKEMREEYGHEPQLRQDLDLLRKQVDRCKEILTSLTSSAGDMRATDANGVALDDFLEGTIQRWRDIRPAVRLHCRISGKLPAPRIATDLALGMALINLLDNAADASPEQVDIEGEWDQQLLKLDIRDYGPGITDEAAQRAGTPFFTTKREEGMGLGLYLSRIILSRFDGSVKLDRHPQQGTVTSIRLPLNGLILRGGACCSRGLGTPVAATMNAQDWLHKYLQQR